MQVREIVEATLPSVEDEPASGDPAPAAAPAPTPAAPAGGASGHSIDLSLPGAAPARGGASGGAGGGAARRQSAPAGGGRKWMIKDDGTAFRRWLTLPSQRLLALLCRAPGRFISCSWSSQRGPNRLGRPRSHWNAAGIVRGVAPPAAGAGGADGRGEGAALQSPQASRRAGTVGSIVLSRSAQKAKVGPTGRSPACPGCCAAP